MHTIDILSYFQAAASNATDMDIPYNFLIGGDGQTYEARGWSFESGFKEIPQNTSLTIGFMGE